MTVNKNEISVVLSSRNNAEFDEKNLSNIRKEIKEQIEETKFFGQQLFSVWRNEDEVADGSQDIWNKCLETIREVEIVIVLFNGETGWVVNGDDTIGICHAEMMEAMNTSMEKVYLIDISDNHVGAQPKDKAFKEYLDSYQIWKAIV